jgi:hypothetical protein
MMLTLLRGRAAITVPMARVRPLHMHLYTACYCLFCIPQLISLAISKRFHPDLEFSWSLRQKHHRTHMKRLPANRLFQKKTTDF